MDLKLVGDEDWIRQGRDTTDWMRQTRLVTLIREYDQESGSAVVEEAANG